MMAAPDQTWTDMNGKLVRGRGDGSASGYEILDLYLSPESYRRQRGSHEKRDDGFTASMWLLPRAEERPRPVEISRKDFWTVVAINFSPDGKIYMMKIVSPDGTNCGWTPHFYRLELA